MVQKRAYRESSYSQVNMEVYQTLTTNQGGSMAFLKKFLRWLLPNPHSCVWYKKGNVRYCVGCKSFQHFRISCSATEYDDPEMQRKMAKTIGWYNYYNHYGLGPFEEELVREAEAFMEKAKATSDKKHGNDGE